MKPPVKASRVLLRWAHPKRTNIGTPIIFGKLFEIAGGKEFGLVKRY